MSEFLTLKPDDQSDILSAISVRTGRSAQILQKDVWICWVLKVLFEKDAGSRMVFKGGTSLSKVFGLIHRFSEDVDITLDYRDLIPAIPSPDGNLNKSQLKQLSKRLQGQVRVQVHDVIAPLLSAEFLDLTKGEGRIDISEDGEKIWLYYPSVAGSTSGYIQDSVLLEFGGRNTTEPNEQHRVTPFLASDVPDLDFPEAEAAVLVPARTFWEKATLMHVECNRQRTEWPDRLFRHWYDLVMLSLAPIGVEAMANRTLLRDVVEHKKMFYDASYAHYDDCLNGAFRLIPNKNQIRELERDYKEMIKAGMFENDPPKFSEIMAMLQECEGRINCVDF